MQQFVFVGGLGCREFLCILYQEVPSFVEYIGLITFFCSRIPIPTSNRRMSCS
eukprot:c26919_g1_i1 orf=448-606(+)